MRRAGLILLGALAVAGCGEERTRAALPPDPAPPAAPVALPGGGVELVGLAGEDVIARDGNAVLALRPGKRRVLLRQEGLRGAVAGGAALALTTANYDDDTGGPYLSSFVGPDTPPEPSPRTPRDRTVVRGGPIAGPLQVLLSCSGVAADEVLPPVAAGRTVATRSCDRRRVIVLDGAARADRDGGGEVLAVAAAGRRLGWVARERAGSPARLHLVDLDAGTDRTLELPVVSGQAAARLQLAADGRVHAEVAEPGNDPTTISETCRATSIAADGGEPAKAACASNLRFTDEGTLSVRGGRRKLDTVLAIERRDRSGRLLGVLQRQAASFVPNLAVNGSRVAVTAATCRRTRVLLERVDSRQRPFPYCPVRLAGRPRLSGVTLRVPVRCPRGCAFPAGATLATLGAASRAPANAPSANALDLRRGGRATLRFRFDAAPPERASLGTLSVVNVDGTTSLLRLDR